MKVNVNRTKVTVLSWKRDEKVSIGIDGKKVEAASKLKYLGSWITNDGRDEIDIKVTIPMI